MSVISTDDWLHEFKTSQKLMRSRDLEDLQCTILCSRLLEHFLGGTPQLIQYELQQQGLFRAHEKINMKKLQEHHTWNIVQEEFLYLQKKWSGPDIPIYIFPLTQEQNLTNKNGVAYPDALFLLIGELEKQELKALFAHEYNHVCRLQYLNKSLKEVTLLDSIILEGLAECAVEEIYGAKWLAPWLNNYSFKKMLTIWRSHFLPNINVKGLDNHIEFLYGGKLPPWIGYCIGYEIVKSYIQHHSSTNVLIQSSKNILKGSTFSL
ncbi:DUF2268 domain-containing protein [Lysinibacillus sp. NPDC097195]|uniref:DUF2268 domain-containing protein n=1 Tax=Lysinibacillus sp. NPDC097195 TaxID=3364141 RepID=UPI0037F94C7A